MLYLIYFIVPESPFKLNILWKMMGHQLLLFGSLDTCRSLGHLMHVLQSSPIDYVRNESLGLLLLITASNTDIQTHGLN